MKKVKHLSLRIDEETLEKFKYFCEYEGRSANAQLLYFIRNSIKDFEKENGEIVNKEWFNMTQNELKQMANRIKARRESFLYTQESFSELIDISASSYTKIENAFQKPSLDTLIKISQNLYVSVDYLLFGDEQQNQIKNDDIITKTVENIDIDDLKTIAKFLNKLIECKKD